MAEAKSSFFLSEDDDEEEIESNTSFTEDVVTTEDDNFFLSEDEDVKIDSVATSEDDNFFLSEDEDVTTEATSPVFTPPKEGMTYEQYQASPELKAAAVRFAKDRLGYDTITEADALDETLEHFRQFKVNELTAGRDWNYTSALTTDKKSQEINDYKSLYRATESVENFAGGVGQTVGDYLGGIATAPSTLLGLILPGGGKLAGIAAQQAAKLRVGRFVAGLAANPIKTIVATEATAGVLQDVAQQKSLMEVDEQDEYSFGQTAIAGTISGVGTGIVSSLPMYLAKKRGLKKFSKSAQTDDLLDTSKKVYEERVAKAEVAATKTIDEGGEESQKIITRLKKLNEERVEKGDDLIEGMTKAENLDGAKVVIPPDKLNRIGAAAVEILANSKTGLRTFESTNIKGDKIIETERITDAIDRITRDAMSSPDSKVYKSVIDTYEKVMKKYSLSIDDIGALQVAEVSNAARIMARQSHNKQNYNRFVQSLDRIGNSDLFSLSDEAMDTLDAAKKAAKKDDAQGALKQFEYNTTSEFLRSADALRLAAMTSQVGTTVRNTVGGVLRVGIDTVTTALDLGLQIGVSKLKGEKLGKISGKDWKDNTFAVAYGLINKDKSIAVEEIFAMGFQKQAQKMYRQLADLEDVSGKLVKGGAPPSKVRNFTTGLGRNLNVLNTLSDNMFKRAAFMGAIQKELLKMKRLNRSKGIEVKDSQFELVDIMRKGKFKDVFGTKDGMKALDRAVEEALYFTYQASPKSPMGQLLIKGANKLPFLTTSLVPFPRFLANAMRFTYEYSPFFLMSKKVRYELGRTVGGKEGVDDFGIRSYHNTAKGLTGFGLVIAGLAYRKTYGGEKWNEGKSEDGETYDLRPFFPAAPYLYFGELLRRIVDGEDVTDQKTAKEAIAAVTGMQVGKAGFGMYALDKFVDDVGTIATDATSDDSQVASDTIIRAVAEFSANILSTYTMPLTPFQDTYNTFLAPDDERIIRENKVDSIGSLMLHKTIARVPGNFAIETMLNKAFGTEYNIPNAYESPTREGFLRRTAPISRQIYGRLYQGKKSKIEQTFDKLRITKSQVMRRTGVPAADQLLGFYMGEVVTDIIGPYLKTDAWKSIPEKFKKDALLQEIAKVREFVTDMAKRTTVEDRYGKTSNPYDKVRFLRIPKVYRGMAKKVYSQRRGGEITPLQDYNYTQLFKIAKELSKTDLSEFEFKELDLLDELKETDPTSE